MSVRWGDVEKDVDKKKEFLVFIFLSVVGLGINQILMWIFVSRLYYLYMVAKIFVTAIVMVYNFITRKIFLERQ